MKNNFSKNLIVFLLVLSLAPNNVFAAEKKLLKSPKNKEKIVQTKAKEAPLPTPAPEATKELVDGNAGLKSALEFVYENNPKIKAQREALKIIDEGVNQALSGFKPSASANLSKGRGRIGDANDTWNYNNSKSRSLDVEQPIFSGGSSIAGFYTAKDKVKAARAELSALEQQVLYDAVVAYTGVVESQAVLELSQKNTDVLKHQMEVTQARFDVGELTQTDVAQAASRLAIAQANERQSLGDLEISKATFRHAIGYDVPDKITMPSVPQKLPETITQAKEIAGENSPILEAARHNKSAAENNVFVSGAALLPNVSLQGTMSRADGVSNNINSLDSDAIKLNISIPLYQSGAEWSRLRAARNAAEQAKFNEIDSNEAVAESVANAWESYRTATAIITSNDATVKAAQTALEGVHKENEFGIRTILDVLNAEQELFSAQVSLVKATRNEKIQAYRLLATIGKLTSKELELKTNAENPKEHYNNVKYQLLGL